jgi:hypothetical protein
MPSSRGIGACAAGVRRQLRARAPRGGGFEEQVSEQLFLHDLPQLQDGQLKLLDGLLQRRSHEKRLASRSE